MQMFQPFVGRFHWAVRCAVVEEGQHIVPPTPQRPTQLRALKHEEPVIGPPSDVRGQGSATDEDPLRRLRDRFEATRNFEGEGTALAFLIGVEESISFVCQQLSLNPAARMNMRERLRSSV